MHRNALQVCRRLRVVGGLWEAVGRNGERFDGEW